MMELKNHVQEPWEQNDGAQEPWEQNDGAQEPWEQNDGAQEPWEQYPENVLLNCNCRKCVRE